MTKRIYLVTEGVHDVAFLGKLLTVNFGFERIRSDDRLDDGWRSWIKANFKWPPNRRGTQGARDVDGVVDIGRLSVPAPLFYARANPSEITLAITNAEGIDRINETLKLHLHGLRLQKVGLDAVGVILDADDAALSSRFARMANKLAALGLPRPGTPGEVLGDPRTGIFILPDGQSPGTLEDILLAVGRAVYPALYEAAEAFVGQSKLSLDQLLPRERMEVEKRAGTKKATIAAMGAVLKPGKAIQTTLEDHRWVSDESVAMPEMAPCTEFLRRLLEPTAAGPAGLLSS